MYSAFINYVQRYFVEMLAFFLLNFSSFFFFFSMALLVLGFYKKMLAFGQNFFESLTKSYAVYWTYRDIYFSVVFAAFYQNMLSLGISTFQHFYKLL